MGIIVVIALIPIEYRGEPTEGERDKERRRGEIEGKDGGRETERRQRRH
jgi:hypothetical protein